MNLSTKQYQLQGELTECHVGKIMLQGELRSIKGYSFHVTKCPRMVIVVLPVSGNNYFILEGEYSAPPPGAHLRDFWREKNLFFLVPMEPSNAP